jgi:hypothetical protein
MSASIEMLPFMLIPGMTEILDFHRHYNRVKPLLEYSRFHQNQH